ncbi:MAG: PEP-CTERM system histidine kinase PrsK [Gammaproteobacteria bacterium]|nr:PEP-CTERM system histidine kinase PrsK [Gammaproteobacteria bacterium]
MIAEIWSLYGLAGLAGLALALQLLLPGSSRLLPRHRAAVATATLGWALYLSIGFDGTAIYQLTPTDWIIEFLLLLSWFALLFRLQRGPYKQSMPEFVRRAFYLFWGVMLGAGLLTLWLGQSGPDALDVVLPAILLAASLACVALAAQLQRDAPVEDRRALRGFVFGGLLLGSCQALWSAMLTMAPGMASGTGAWRGLAVAIAALLVMDAVRRRPQWSLAVFVSPQARAYAPRLLTLAGLLIVYLAASPLIRALPEPPARVLALTLVLVTALPAIALVYSENLSARLRVFISKHFLPFRYDYREEWLRLIDTLAAPAQRLPLPERTIKAVAQIVGSPAGVLWLRRYEDEPFTCVAHWNTRAWPDTPVLPDDPVIEFMTERQWILDTAELQRDPDLYEGMVRPEWLERFPDALLVVPLISNEMLLGFMVLFQSSSAFRLTYEEIDLLRTSGRQVAAYLAQYQADQQLAEAQQFEAFNRLTAFVMHDLKNLIAQQSLVVKNATRHKDNPAFFEDAIATIENSVARMNRLLKQLQSGEGTGANQRVSLSNALQEAIERVEGRSPVPRFDSIDGDRAIALLDRERFIAVVAHLLHNAQDATPAEGDITVSLVTNGQEATIAIRDSGSGMEPEFVRSRLFRPFDSTKGSQGMGIGAYQARTFAVAAGGRLDVRSEPGRGSIFTINLPIEPAAEKLSA